MQTSRTLRWWMSVLLVAVACGSDEEDIHITPIPPGVPSPPSLQAPTTTVRLQPSPPRDYAADVSASPSWSRPPDLTFGGVAQYISRIPNASGELESTGPIGADFVGVLVCRVEVTEHKDWDSRGLFGAHVEPDLLVGGGAAEVLLHAVGPEDAYSFVASFPNVRLDAGFTLEVLDRDINGDDPVETLRLTQPTGPQPSLSVTGERARARCGGISEQDALLRAEAPIAALTRITTHLESQPSPSAPMIASLLEPAKAQARLAAAWLGWGHVALKALVDRLDAVEARWVATHADGAAEAGAVVEFPGMSAQVLDHECTDGRCRARLRVSYTRAGFVVNFVALTSQGEVLATEVSSEPSRSAYAQALISAPGVFIHTFEWAADEPPSRAIIRQFQDEAVVELQ